MNTSQTLSTANTLSGNTLSAGDVIYYRERQRNRVFETVWQEFVTQVDLSGLTKKVIADRLGKNPSQITRWFSGPGNWELDTISDLLLAMNCELVIGVSSLLNRPTANYMHPAAIMPQVSGVWVNSTAPINFGANSATGSLSTGNVVIYKPDHI
jgi:hypothetical protein